MKDSKLIKTVNAPSQFHRQDQSQVNGNGHQNIDINNNFLSTAAIDPFHGNLRIVDTVSAGKISKELEKHTQKAVETFILGA